MRFASIAFWIVLMGLAGAGADRAAGQDSKPNPLEEAARLQIVPLVVLKPGESKELFLTTACTVGVTRGGGFDLRQMGGNGDQASDQRVWKQHGLVVEVPDFETGPKQAASPEYQALLEAGLNAFSVKVTSVPEARPGVYNFHLVDQTCNGWCKTDFRVLVVAPSKE